MGPVHGEAVVTPELGLRFLAEHPEALGLTLRRPGALAWLAVVALIVVLGRRQPGWRLATALRTGAATALVLALAGLALTVQLPNDRLSLVAAVDLSQSIPATGHTWQQQYLERLASALAPGDELGIVVFGREAAVVQPPGPARVVRQGAAPVTASATDIQRGLETALALLPSDAERRVLLLSDGNETRGDGLATAARARQAGVTIHAAVPPAAAGLDVAVEKLTTPPLVAEDSVFPVRVTVRNRGPQVEAPLQLRIDETPIGTETVTLQPGLNAIEIPYRLSGAGGHRLRADVTAPGDTIAGNDYRETPVMIGGKVGILLISDRPHPPLAAALERKGVAVTTLPAERMPRTVGELLAFHCVVLSDAEAGRLDRTALAVLEQYVKDYGGGLVVAAGDRTYGDAGFRKTALQRLLPVTLEPRRPPRAERAPVSLFLIIDRSNSMGYHVTQRMQRSEDNSKLAYARRAALAVIGQLKDSDQVGVIAFDSRPYDIATLRSLRDNRLLLERDIPRLQPGGGTDFFDALDAARTQLAAARAQTAHIMLLTDGDTNRASSDHASLIAALAKAGISVTAIRIGEDTVNLELLEEMATRTGGAFYHVENAETLPELLLRDASQAVERAPRREVTFVPRPADATQALRGLALRNLPELSGYAYTRPKPGADLLLYVAGAPDRRDPLLAAWQYGLGRVVAFTASLDDDAETWVGWDGFSKFWSQVVRWTLRDQMPWAYAVDVDRREGQSQLRVRTFGDVDDGVLAARLLDSDRAVDVTLAPTAPREFAAPLPTLPGGRYPVAVTRRDGQQTVTQRTEFVWVPGRDAEPQEEFMADQPNRPWLEQLTAATGGAVDPPLERLVGRVLGTRQATFPLDWLVVPLAMVWFLCDLGLRYVRGPGAPGEGAAG